MGKGKSGVRYSPLELSDRGPARCFNGRTRIRKVFAGVLRDAGSDSRASTIFLVHGPLGAVKTALLYELAKTAKGARWRTAEIIPTAFDGPAEMADAVGVNYIPEKKQASGNFPYNRDMWRKEA